MLDPYLTTQGNTCTAVTHIPCKEAREVILSGNYMIVLPGSSWLCNFVTGTCYFLLYLVVFFPSFHFAFCILISVQFMYMFIVGVIVLLGLGCMVIWHSAPMLCHLTGGRCCYCSVLYVYSETCRERPVMRDHLSERANIPDRRYYPSVVISV